MDIKIEKYNKDRKYSFTFGAFPTFELIKNKPQQVECLLLHSKLKETEDIVELINLCKQKNIPNGYVFCNIIFLRIVVLFLLF